MADYGYFSIPRSLTRDFEEFEISLKYQKIFLIILDYMAFEEKEMNNSGLKVLVKPFQLLASENTLLEWCNKGLRSEDKISESMIHRALTKFESLGWISKENFKKSGLPQGENEYVEIQHNSLIQKTPSHSDLSKNVNNNFKKRRQNGECQKSNQLPNQLSNQQKCLLIVLRNDIINIHKQPIEPATEPAANQLRTSSEPQRKKENKEKESLKNIKEEDLLKSSHVHNSKSEVKKPDESCEQDELFDDESLFSNIKLLILNNRLSEYRFPDGNALFKADLKRFSMYTDHNQNKLIRNWELCIEEWEAGKLPYEGNYMQMLQGYFKNDIAGKRKNKARNIEYAQFIKKEYDLSEMRQIKTGIKFGKELKIDYELPPETFNDCIANYLERRSYITQ